MRRFKALVPMKAHSERVANKNVRDVCGRALFHWIMDSLARSSYVDEIIVNTDSPEIAEDARSTFGVTIHERPEHLLGDMIGIAPLIDNDLSRSEGEHYLQTHATNPLVRCETIDAAVERFLEAEGESDSLFTVTPLHTRLYSADGVPINHNPDRLLRTQDLPPVYEENSCLYLFTRTSFYPERNRIGKRPILFPMDPLEAVDIDDESDLVLARLLMQRRLEGREEARAAGAN